MTFQALKGSGGNKFEDSLMKEEGPLSRSFWDENKSELV